MALVIFVVVMIFGDKNMNYDFCQSQFIFKKILHFFVTFYILTVLNKTGRTHLPKPSPIHKPDSKGSDHTKNFFRN